MQLRMLFMQDRARPLPINTAIWCANVQGQKGAQARAIFNGKVAAVFKLNGPFNVLVRHGAYISVYCNLSSVNVKQGDTVVTKQELGTIFSNIADGGRTVLHFQLRKEKDKLNPEPWLNR